MHRVRMAVLALLIGCDQRPPDDGKTSSPADTATSPTDTGGSPGDSDMDTSGDTAGDTGTADCREEGESCTPSDDFPSGDCCNTRHTCFPEGCYYSLPG